MDGLFTPHKENTCDDSDVDPQDSATRRAIVMAWRLIRADRPLPIDLVSRLLAAGVDVSALEESA